jgi:hypothetical protein
VNEQTQPTAPFLALVLVVAVGAAYAVAASPIGDAVRATWDSFTLWSASLIGA